ncbi:DUF4145 domain-containing protein [Nitrososphaera viennensis]|nr:DUF4145 domain-containing protein [Nitrososphaera viennensis]UVS70657.1 DUF4145 domain-containing protein [Nitrososphaera viennensis]
MSKEKRPGLKKYDDRLPSYINVDRLRRELEKFDKKTFDDRIQKMVQLNLILGEERYMMTESLAVYYFQEAKTCFIFSQFAASIIMCQLVCEEMIKSVYRSSGNTKIVNDFNFAQLIDKATEDQIIPPQFAKRLHDMRKFRNIIEHSKDYSDEQMRLFLGNYYGIALQLKAKAIESMELAVMLMNSLSFG